MELAEAARAQIDAGDREAALAVLAGAENSLPLHAGHIYSWRAALLAEIGHTDAALDALDAALAAGCRFKTEWLRDNPRLAPLQGMARFDDVVDRAASRYTRMQAETRPALEAFVPTTPRPAPPGYPTLIALHGNNSNVGQTQPYWETATALGWVVALPQSGEIGTSPNSFTWNDRDRTLAEVEQHLQDLRAQSLVDERAVVLAGFSMGGLQALALVLTRRFKARGVLSVGAYLPHIREFRPLIESGNAAGVRFYIVVGTKDTSGYDGAKQLATELERAGVDVVLDARTDLGHDYPPNMAETLRRALTFIGSPSQVASRQPNPSR
jgi:predicted esterase